MTTEDITYLKAALVAKRQELASAIRSATSDMVFDKGEPDLLEHVQSMAARDQQAIMLNRLSDTLEEVERSLRAFADGSYGVCAVCDEPIAPRRLRTIPWAALCVRCQERLEARSTFAPAGVLDSACGGLESRA